MPKGNYKIIATRYHESLPKDVLPLITGKDNPSWGYVIEKNIRKMYLSENTEQLMKNLVIAQIRADPYSRLEVSLELCIEDEPAPPRIDILEGRCCPNVGVTAPSQAKCTKTYRPFPTNIHTPEGIFDPEEKY